MNFSSRKNRSAEPVRLAEKNINFFVSSERLRNRFSMLFIELLKKQLVLKNIMSLKQCEDIKLKIHFVKNHDQHSNFNSLKNLELLSEKMNVLREAAVAQNHTVEYLMTLTNVTINIMQIISLKRNPCSNR